MEIAKANPNLHAKNQLCIFNILEVMSSQSYVTDIGDYSHSHPPPIGNGSVKSLIEDRIKMFFSHQTLTFYWEY